MDAASGVGPARSTTVAVVGDGDTSDVIALVLRIQTAEHGGPDSEAELVDLRTVSSYYRGGASGFWVARDGDRVVGTVGIQDLGRGAALLKRMYVAPSHRGPVTGTARRLLDAAVAAAERHGVTRLYLGTMAEPVAAPRFYQKNGFTRIERRDLPREASMSAMDTLFYARELPAPGTH